MIGNAPGRATRMARPARLRISPGQGVRPPAFQCGQLEVNTHFNVTGVMALSPEPT